MIHTRSYELMALSLFLLGVCSAGRWAATYIYLVEFWSEAHIKRYGPFVNACSALTLAAGAFSFQFLTTETVFLEYIAAFASFLTCALGYFLLPESPKWLIA